MDGMAFMDKEEEVASLQTLLNKLSSLLCTAVPDTRKKTRKETKNIFCHVIPGIFLGAYPGLQALLAEEPPAPRTLKEIIMIEEEFVKIMSRPGILGACRLGNRVHLPSPEEVNMWTNAVCEASTWRQGVADNFETVIGGILSAGFLVGAQLPYELGAMMDAIVVQQPTVAHLVVVVLERLGRLQALRVHAQSDAALAPYLPALPLAELLAAPLHRRDDLLRLWLAGECDVTQQAADAWIKAMDAAWEAALLERSQALAALHRGQGFTRGLAEVLRRTVAHRTETADADGGCLGARELASTLAAVMARHHGLAQLCAAAVARGGGLSPLTAMAIWLGRVVVVVAAAVELLKTQLLKSQDDAMELVSQAEGAASLHVAYSASAVMHVTHRIMPDPEGALTSAANAARLMKHVDTFQRVYSQDAQLRERLAPVRHLLAQAQELGLSAGMVSHMITPLPPLTPPPPRAPPAATAADGGRRQRMGRRAL